GEVGIPGAPASGDDDALAGADVHRFGLLPGPLVGLDHRDSDRSSRQGIFAVNLRHLLLQQDLDAHVAGSPGKWADEAGPPCGARNFIGPHLDVEPRAGAIETIGSGPISFPLDAM